MNCLGRVSAGAMVNAHRQGRQRPDCSGPSILGLSHLRWLRHFLSAGVLALALVAPSIGAAETAPAAASMPVTTEALEALKKEAVALNRDLFILEEDLLFPSSTQVAVFVSVDVGRYFQLDSVKLSMDGQVLNHYLYTARDWDALKRGGVQRLYVGNLTAGKHELVALFTGRAGAENRESTRASSLQFNKETGPKYVELKIIDDAGKQQAIFDVREW